MIFGFAAKPSRLGGSPAALRLLLGLACCALAAGSPAGPPPAATRPVPNGLQPPSSAPTADEELRLLRTRLQAELRNHYLRAADHERESLISSFLADPLPVIRRLGLELVQARLTEGAVVSPPIGTRVRELADDPADAVRAAAVVAITALRDPADEAKLLTLIQDLTRPQTRSSAVNGLGYVGSDACFAVLLGIAETRDAELRLAAVSALSRLVERGVLRPESLTALERRLVLVLKNADPATRERVLFSLGRMTDPELAPLFEQIAESNRGPAERLTAFRSLTQLGDEWSLPCARRLALSLEPSLRRVAVEVLRRAGQDAADLALLVRLLSCDAEADEAIRSSAWSGALRIASEAGIDVLRELADALPPSDPDWSDRMRELAAAAEGLVIAEDSASLEHIRSLARRASEVAGVTDPPGPIPTSRATKISAVRAWRR